MNNYQAFSFICDVLAYIDNRHSLLELIKSGIAWERVIEVASKQLVTPSLYLSLKNKNLIDEIPGDVLGYFQAIHELNREHNQEFLDDLLQAGHQLNESGITPVVMKGGAALLDNLYGDIGGRLMGDVDLLVEKQQINTCFGVMNELGYVQYEDFLHWPEHCPHYPPFGHQDKRIRFEFHVNVVPTSYRHLLTADEVLSRANRIQHGQAALAVPNPTHRLIHNVIHAQLDDEGYRRKRIYLRQLYEFVTLRLQFEGEIDWREIQKRFHRKQEFDALANFLILAEKYLACPVPEGMQLAQHQYGRVASTSWRMNHPRLSSWLTGILLSPYNSWRFIFNLDYRMEILSQNMLYLYWRSTLRQPKNLLKLFNPACYLKYFKNIRKSRNI